MTTPHEQQQQKLSCYNKKNNKKRFLMIQRIIIMSNRLKEFIKVLEKEHDDIATIIQYAGKDIDNETDAYGDTALMFACRRNYLKSVEALCSLYDADVNETNVYDHSALMVAGSVGVVNALLSHHSDYNYANHCGDTALMVHCTRYNYHIIRRLLQISDINVNAQNCKGNTALHVCAIYGYRQGAELLLDDHRCDKYMKNTSKLTAETLARSRGFVELADLIRDHEISVDL